MMRKILLHAVFLLVMAFGWGQSIQGLDDETAKQIQKIPLESVYLHFNESLLFSGEKLRYKFYCFNNNTKQLSHISRMGYVSLIAKGGSIVFRQKVVLEAGLGYGDFFIPTSVATGSYKLMAYSNSMKNASTKVFFQSNIKVINPYQKTPETHISSYSDSLIGPNESIENSETVLSVRQNENAMLSVVVDKPLFNTREEVKLKIKMLDEIRASGNYSLSVRKTNGISFPHRTTANVFFADFAKKSGSLLNSNGFKGFIPELRGELISGVIRNKDTGIPVANQRISLSLPGDNFTHKIAVSNDLGEFHFNLNFRYDNADGVLQVLSESWSDFEITMYDSTPDYDDLSFEEFTLTEVMKDDILERSIQNQLEIAYQQVKLDSILTLNYGNPFYRNLSTTYYLDDYTRFNGIPETIIEVIDHVSTRKLSNGDRVFAVRPEVGVPNNILPMVFIDGLFIKRHEDIMDINAKRVKSISFSRDLFVLGAQNFQGVLHFETIEGNFHEDFYSPHMVKIDLFKPELPKKYYSEKYTEKIKKSHVPDYRRQLLWLPNLVLKEKETTIAFFTSDVDGTYEISLEGFTNKGIPVHLKGLISVE